MSTFKGLPVVRKTTADKVNLPEIIIRSGMEKYSGWGFQEHVKWVAELTGIDFITLSLALGKQSGNNYMLATDESCSEVWLLSDDFYKTTVRLIYIED